MFKYLLFFAVSLNAFELDVINSNFTQTIINSQNSKIIYSGYVAASGKKAYWHYITPIEKKIYIGTKIVMIEPELEQVVYMSSKEVPDIFKILRSAKSISDNELEASYAGLVYHVFLKDGLLFLVKYVDKVGNKVVLKFDNLGGSVPDSTFDYKIPFGYDVLS